MIQRIQSIWLFFAAFASAALFIFPLYHYTPAGSAIPLLMGAKNEYLLLLLAALMTLLPMITIFMFKNRKRQTNLIWLSILASAGFIAAMLMKIQNLKNAVPPATNDNFALPGPVIPVVVIVLLILALSGVRKDEALIRSVDRLR
ncbi:MAG TPA: DUF4293 family protein [Chitinophagaceae bacterium]|nr:DUF4293 family protein [Chitinophagaceae bacterium]